MIISRTENKLIALSLKLIFTVLYLGVVYAYYLIKGWIAGS